VDTNSPDILGNPDIQMAAMANDIKAKMRAQIADTLISTKMWGDMDKKERKLCIDHMIAESETEAELRQRLAEIGVGSVAVNWLDVDSNDTKAREAQMLVKALGGPIAKNGAMVMVSTMDDFD
jgi:hypothetical protein